MEAVIIVTDLKSGHQRAFTTLSKAAKATNIKAQTIRAYMSRNDVSYYNTSKYEIAKIPIG